MIYAAILLFLVSILASAYAWTQGWPVEALLGAIVAAGWAAVISYETARTRP